MGDTGLRRNSESRAEQTDDSTSQRHRSSISESVSQSTSRSTGTSPTSDRADIESRYGLELYAPGQDVQLQRLEQACGPAEVQGWVDEGMPVELMGKPVDMDAFRERQAERPAAVPKDIERQNAASVQRSREAQYDTDRAGDAGVPASVRDVLSTLGQPLDGGIQRAMEERMGDSLGDVRIHADATAARACEDINARAFTVGNHIAFNHGEYDPESPDGQHLLAHELAHVRQQTGAAISMLPQEDSGLEIDPDPRLEREAEDAAKQAMADGPVAITRLGTAVHIQRMPETERLQAAREEVASGNDEMTLAQTVSRLEERVASLEEVVTGDDSVVNGVGKALSQGAVGTIGGLIGGVAGTAVSPGLGTIGGAAVGQEMAKGMAGDVTKTLTGQAYDEGTDFVAEKGSQARAFLEQLIEEKVNEALNGSDYGGDSRGLS